MTTDDVFLAEIDVSIEKCPLAFITTGDTTGNEWPLSGDEWDAVVAAGGARTARVTWAYLSNNVVTEGPVRATTDRAFSIAK